MNLILERKEQADETPMFQGKTPTGKPGGILMMTPPVGEDYWTYRVPVGHGQAVIGFPKFGTIGIGFQEEGNDWNTNLPWTCPAEKIFSHIRKNKGDSRIADEECLAAIRMIQAAAKEDGKE